MFYVKPKYTERVRINYRRRTVVFYSISSALSCIIVIAPAFAPRYDNNRGHSRCCNYYAGTIIILFVSCVRVRLSPIGVGIIGNI